METVSKHCCEALNQKPLEADIKRILEELKEGKSFLVLSHQNPEGDALGSTLAIAFALKSMGKSVTTFNQDGVPDNLMFLPGAHDVSTSLSPDGRYDVILALDCGDPELLGNTFARWRKSIGKSPSIIVIDHHETNKGFGKHNYVDPKASSAGEMIYRLLRKIPVEITPAIATHIYTAILCDTGSFRYSNTTHRAFKIVEEMVRKGADPCEISQHVFETQPLRRIKLLALVLNTLEVTPDGKVASVTILREMYDKTGARKEDAEEFINYTRSIEGVEVGILFREVKENKFRISFRSKRSVDVANIAQEFGGGGHHSASGCSVEGTLEESKEKVLGAVRRHITTT